MLLVLNYEGDPFWKSRCLNMYLHQLSLTYTMQIMSKLRPTLNFIFFPIPFLFFLLSPSTSLKVYHHYHHDITPFFEILLKTSLYI